VRRVMDEASMCHRSGWGSMVCCLARQLTVND
jgi:hypothetical protein